MNTEITSSSTPAMTLTQLLSYDRIVVAFKKLNRPKDYGRKAQALPALKV